MATAIRQEYDLAKARTLLVDFIEKTTVDSASAHTEYKPGKMDWGDAGGIPRRRVPSNVFWLPGADSNHGPGD